MTNNHSKGRAIALLPIAVFLLFFIGSGLITGDFYSMPAIVGFLIALIIAFLQNKKLSFVQKLRLASPGVGDENILTMCLIFLAAGALTVKIQQCRRVFRLIVKRAERRLRCHGIRTLAVTADHAGQLDHTPRPEQHPRSPFHILMPPSLRLEQLFRQKKLPAAAPHPRRHEKAAEKLSPQYGFTSCDHTLRHTAAVGDPLHELRFPVR